ncbi:MAG TPA: YceI family protein [Thermodesulfobacteriota bacterium]|nr:YceI family protein [Thermodesulfobacteriota bacterium]
MLETARYPEIVFKSSNIKATKISENWYRLEIEGELSLHGVTKSEQIDTQVRLNGDVLRASGSFTFTLPQSNYNIKRVSALGGALKVKDDLEFSFDIVAQKDSK